MYLYIYIYIYLYIYIYDPGMRGVSKNEVFKPLLLNRLSLKWRGTLSGVVFYSTVLSLLSCHSTLLLHATESLLNRYTFLVGMLNEEAGNGSFGEF